MGWESFREASLLELSSFWAGIFWRNRWRKLEWLLWFPQLYIMIIQFTCLVNTHCLMFLVVQVCAARVRGTHGISHWPVQFEWQRTHPHLTLVRKVHSREIVSILCLREVYRPLSPRTLKPLNLPIFIYTWRRVDLWCKLNYLVIIIYWLSLGRLLKEMRWNFTCVADGRGYAFLDGERTVGWCEPR